jgi:copper chaperone
MLGMVRRLSRVNSHAADRVADLGFHVVGWLVPTMMGAVTVTMVLMLVHQRGSSAAAVPDTRLFSDVGSPIVGRSRAPVGYSAGLDLPMAASPTCYAVIEEESTMYRFDVPGMKCGGCAKKVEQAVKSKDASAEFSADVENRRVTVTSSVSQAELAAAIQEAGYVNQLVAA